jgi:hypothetical protein
MHKIINKQSGKPVSHFIIRWFFCPFSKPNISSLFQGATILFMPLSFETTWDLA